VSVAVLGLYEICRSGLARDAFESARDRGQARSYKS
jgi:hypothetical protein